ncbi:MAG: hypothetical protein Q7U73_08330 [Rubrivivax sp.]|nr:hypothetical protein [Rubrivivax sp.]
MPVTRSDIAGAAQRIAGHAHRTPLLACDAVRPRPDERGALVPCGPNFDPASMSATEAA